MRTTPMTRAGGIAAIAVTTSLPMSAGTGRLPIPSAQLTMRIVRLVMIGVGLAVLAGTAPAAASAATAAAPPGYQIVSSGPVNAPPSTIVDSGGQVACPSGTVPWGGGVSFIASSNPTAGSINTSAPSVSNGWEARVNNTGTATVQFEVVAVCAQKPSGYKIVSHTVVNPATTLTSTAARCPVGKVLLAGGLFSTSGAASVQSPSAWPVSTTKYKAVLWNGSTTSASLTAYALCAFKPAGYALGSDSATAPSGSLIDAAAPCPSGTSVLGGGVQLASPQAADELFASSPYVGFPQWAVAAYNGTAASQTETNYAICGA